MSEPTAPFCCRPAMFRFRGLSGLVVYLSLFTGSALATEPLVLDGTRDEYPLGLHLELLADPEGQYTIEDVTAPPLADRFEPSQQRQPLVGAPTAWARLTLHNQTPHLDWILVDPVFGHERIDLFFPGRTDEGVSGWVSKTTGDHFPFATRDIKHRGYAFHLPLEPGAAQTVYLRVNSASLGMAHFRHSLWTPSAFAAQDHDAQLVLGLYYGLILVMAIYNLFLFFSLRDRAYLYYVVMIIAAGGWMANWNGLAAEYLWPESTWGWSRTIIFFYGIGSSLILRFVQTFLLTRLHAPRLHHLLSVLLGFSALYVPAALFNLHGVLAPFINYYELVKWITILLVGILVWRRGFRAARFFVIAWAAFIGAGFLINLAEMGLLPHNFITVYGFQIGHALEVVLLSLALADRINLLREEKEAQEAELQTAHKLQMGLMPTEAPQLDGFDLAGRCLPADQVGGDLFQYFHRDGKLGIALADVTGHGMEAAVPVMRFSGLLESEVRHAAGLDQLFGGLNETLHAKLDRRTFVCFAMAELEVAPSPPEGADGQPSTHVLRLSNSGCPYPFHFRAADQQVVELEVDAYPLGVRSATRYQMIETRLAAGDYVVFCSDGIVEAGNATEELFGFERTAEAIHTGCREGLSAEALLERIIAAVKAFAGNEPQGDDQTVVVLHVEA